MFNDVCYFNGKKLNLYNKNVGNILITFTGLRSYKDIKRHFVEYPYYINERGNYCASYCSCLCLNDGRDVNSEILIEINKKSGEVMITYLSNDLGY